MDSPANSLVTDDDLTLRIWEGDESALGDLLVSIALPIERAIRRGFPNISETDVEDVVAEAIKRFWQSRHRYDNKQSVGAYLYKIAFNVAQSLVAGHLNWQKSRNMEQEMDDGWLQQLEQPNETSETLDAIESSQSGICKALKGVLSKLSAIERDVIEVYALAGNHPVKSEMLGIELGRKHYGGVPIPAGTIRQHKLRAKKKIVTEMRNIGYELEKTGM